MFCHNVFYCHKVKKNRNISFIHLSMVSFLFRFRMFLNVVFFFILDNCAIKLLLVFLHFEVSLLGSSMFFSSDLFFLDHEKFILTLYFVEYTFCTLFIYYLSLIVFLFRFVACKWNCLFNYLSAAVKMVLVAAHI